MHIRSVCELDYTVTLNATVTDSIYGSSHTYPARLTKAKPMR